MNMKKLGVLLILFLLVLIIFIVGCAKEIKEEPKTEVQKEQPVAQETRGNRSWKNKRNN